jgi:hypothetical protein
MGNRLLTPKQMNEIIKEIIDAQKKKYDDVFTKDKELDIPTINTGTQTSNKAEGLSG